MIWQILIFTVGCMIGQASAVCNVTLLRDMCTTPFNNDGALVFQGNALNSDQVTALCNNFTIDDSCTSNVAGCSSTDPAMASWLVKRESFGYLCGVGRSVFLLNQACLGKYTLSQLVNGCQTTLGRTTCASLANTSSCYQTHIPTLPGCTSDAATFFATFQDANNVVLKTALSCTTPVPMTSESTSPQKTMRETTTTTSPQTTMRETTTTTSPHTTMRETTTTTSPHTTMRETTTTISPHTTMRETTTTSSQTTMPKTTATSPRTTMPITTATSPPTTMPDTTAMTFEDVVPRVAWGANDWSEPLPELIAPIPYVVIHHTRNRCWSKPACLRLITYIQEHNKERTSRTAQEPMRDIAYNFLIDPFGTIYEGAGWNCQGQHTSMLNDKSLGVALIGTFASSLPTDAAFRALMKLISMGLPGGEYADKLSPEYKIYPHKDLECTTCPGGTFYKNITQMEHYGGTEEYPYRKCQSYSNSIHPQR